MMMAEAAPVPVAPTAAVRSVPWKGWLIALSSTVGFSVAPPIATALIGLGLNPTTMLFVRLWMTTALLTASISVAAPARLRIDRRGLSLAGLTGAATGVAMLLFFWSLTRLDTSISSILFSLYPLVVLGWLALRGEKFTHRNTIRVALGITGVYLLIGAGGRVDWIGVVMVLLSVVVSSFQTVVIQWYLQDYDARTVTLYMVGGMAVVVSLWWAASGADLNVPGWPGWLGIVITAVVSTWLARLGMFASVRNIGGAQVALLAPVETLLTVVWSIIFLGDNLSLVQTVGGGLVIASALLASKRLGWARWR